MSWEVRTMRSGTSFFNATLYRKALLRFWPIWALYGAGWLLVLPLRFLTEAMRRSSWQTAGELTDYLREEAVNIPDLLPMGVWAAALFGVVCAMAVFGYLYSSRSACMMHALPARRETLFFSHYLAGLSFLLLPNLAVYVLMVATELSMDCLALKPLTLWLLVQSGMCLFFFSFAVFCAMFTGHLAALPAFYGILNALAMVVTDLVSLVCRRFLYGFSSFGEGVWTPVGWLTPLYRLTDACYTDAASPGVIYDPAVPAVYAAAGAVLALAALLVYRGRHVESAGDVVAVRAVRPVFKYGFALCTALSGGLAAYFVLSLESQTALMLWLVIWGLAGYFAAEMLLRKSFRVFSAWKGAAVLAAAVVLLSLSVQLDWYGFEGRVPAPEAVTEVTVTGLSSAPYDSGDSGGLTFDDPERIALVTQLHRAVLDGRDQGESGQADGWLYLNLSYHLADGSTVQRSYDGALLRLSDLDQAGTVTHLAQTILSAGGTAAQLYYIDEVDRGRVTDAYLDNVWNAETGAYETVYLDDVSAARLWEAVKQDFAQGNLGRRYLLGNDPARLENTCVTDLVLTYVLPQSEEDDISRSETYSSEWTITLTPQAENTLAVLAEVGLPNDIFTFPTQGEREAAQETYQGDAVDTIELPRLLG